MAVPWLLPDDAVAKKILQAADAAFANKRRWLQQVLKEAALSDFPGGRLPGEPGRGWVGSLGKLQSGTEGWTCSAHGCRTRLPWQMRQPGCGRDDFCVSGPASWACRRRRWMRWTGVWHNHRASRLCAARWTIRRSIAGGRLSGTFLPQRRWAGYRSEGLDYYFRVRIGCQP